MINNTLKLVFLFILITVNSFAKNKDVIVIEDSNIPITERKAIIILPGLGNSKKGTKRQQGFFEHKGYDLFIPDYIDKSGYLGCVNNLTSFYSINKLSNYKEIHVFSYILGSWVINDFIRKNGIQNITSIVYDRSPLQERAPKVVVDRIPIIGRILLGKLVKDLSLLPYQPIQKEDIAIGLVVESKATPIIRHYKKTTLSYGAINWSNLDFNQNHDDLIFTRLNHDEMYYAFEEVGNEILHFFLQHRFTDKARRVNFEWDPFKKYKKH